MSVKIFGIDLSKYEAGIDFDKIIAEGVKFVILRAAYHLGKDTEFETFYKQAKSKNLPVGAYLYTTAKSAGEAREEADFLINDVLKGKQFELPIYYDIEGSAYYSRTKAQNTELVQAFCDTMEKSEYFTGVYSNKSFFDTCLDDSMLKKYSHWVAQWSSECTYADKSVLGMWQFGGETNVLRSNKIAGYVCDQNYMYEDFPQIIKDAKLNGFGKPAASAPNASGMLKRGDKNIGVYLLKQNIMVLRDAKVITQSVDDNDIFGDGTEKAVRQIQKAAGIGQDGLAGPKTMVAIKNLLNSIIK